MPNPKPSDNSQQEILNEQEKRTSLVAACLRTLALPSVFNRELSDDDFDLWGALLKNSPLQGIEYAFDNWGRNGKQWPKPANILELIAVWNLTANAKQNEFKPCGQCDDGWVHGPNTVLGRRTVTRCQCFKDWAARRKAA